MISYPSIDKTFSKSEDYYFFDKLDGSNIRAEWSLKKGFYKFGSRKQLIDENNELLGESVTLIKQMNKKFTEIAKKNKIEKFVAFFEFFGETSFAGNHYDEPHKVVLIEMNIFKKGFLDPKDFIKIFENTTEIETAKLLHVGKANATFIDLVKNGKLEGMTFEGVIGKRFASKTKRDYFKLKNKSWLEKLKKSCGDDEALFNKLK